MDSNLEKVFRLFDKDDSKAITVGELKEILGSSKSVSLRVWK
jgi:Ca2+-binding EF-hand superfamily protein